MAQMGAAEIQSKYLIKLESMLTKGTAIKFAGARTEVVKKTDTITQLIKAIQRADINKVKSILKPNGTSYAGIFNGLKWSDIDKQPFSGAGGDSSASSGLPDAASTKKQENASLYAIKSFIEANGAFANEAAFYKKHKQQLLKIYPEMDSVWEKTFFEQGKKIQQEVGATKYNHYSRDNGFMEDIATLVKTKYRISQKDTWNPADVWLVANYNAEKQFLLACAKDDVTSIQEFNSELRHKFGDRKIIGVSLKKMSGKTAKWEVVNLEDSDIFYDDEYRFRFEKAVCKLSVDSRRNLSTSDTLIYLKGKKMTIKFQIRQQAAHLSPLKIEGTDMKNASAKLGKAPLDMVDKVFKGNKLKFNNNKKEFPQTLEEFMNEKDKFASMYEKLKTTRYDIDFDGVNKKEDFIENMRIAFNGPRPDFAHSKLMQLNLLHEVFTNLDENQVEEFWTDLAYLCQKKGEVFGPFGKLY